MTNPDAAPAPRGTTAGLWAAFTVLGLDALALLGAGLYLGVRSAGNGATDQRAAITQAVFALIAAAIFGALARGTWPSHPSVGVRTPAVILEVIAVPVAVGLFQSGRPGIGAPLLVSALVAIGGLAVGFRSGNDPGRAHVN